MMLHCVTMVMIQAVVSVAYVYLCVGLYMHVLDVGVVGGMLKWIELLTN